MAARRRAPASPSGRASAASTSSSCARTTDLAALVDEAVADGADALGVAGGDGSLAVVAAAALAHGLPFVCVPAGTRNHFALDLGVDRGDLVGSLDAFTDGVERRIDVAEVNGRLFLNNVSLGIYGDAVRQPAYRDAKARTLLRDGRASARTERRRSRPAARGRPRPPASQPCRRARVEQPLLARPAACTRHPADARQRTARGHRPRHAARRPEPGADVDRDATRGDRPRARPRRIDGEAVDLDPPLRFVIRPGALRVRIPSSHAGVAVGTLP